MAQTVVSSQEIQRISLAPILSVNFVGTLGFSIVMPFLVFLVTRWGGNALIYGIVGAAYSFFQLIGAPILGRWSDRIGRRKVLLVSQLGTLISWCIFLIAFFVPEEVFLQIDSDFLGKFSLTVPLILLFVARGADGLTGGNVSVAAAYLADITSNEKRTENFGKMAISTNLGFILGPALAGLLAATALGEMLPVIAALIISIAASLIILIKLPESQPCVMQECPQADGIRKTFGQEQKECFEIKGELNTSLKKVLAMDRIPLLLTLYFLVMLAFNFFYIAFPIYAVQILDWTVASTGVFFTVMSIMMVLVQGPVLTRLSRKWSDTKLITIGSLSLTLGFAFYSSTDTVIIYSGTALLALGNGLMWSSLVAVLSRAAGNEMQGVVQGYAGSVGAVASILGLIIGGLLFNYLDRWVFLLAAAMILILFVISFRLKAEKTPFNRTPVSANRNNLG